MSAPKLRDYQVRAVIQARDAFRLGRRAVLLVANCGTGKTTIFSFMAAECVARGGTVVVFVHRIELVDQAVERLRLFGLEVGHGGRHPKAPVQVTTVQTVTSRREMPPATLAIFDEAHILGADEWMQIPMAYLAAGTRIVGFSATPERGDNVGLGGVFDSMIVVAQPEELIAAGYMLSPEIIAPTGHVKKLAQDPWKAYADHGGGRSCVVFAPNVPTCERFVADFRTAGVHAEMVEANTPMDERRAVLARFAAGVTSVICNVAILTTGWNVERAKVCILARKVGSPALYLQMAGRVLRPWENVPATLIDLCGNVEAHGLPDEERVWSLDGAACSRAAARDGLRFCTTCKCEIPKDADRCPDCARPASVVAIPEAELVELARLDRLAQRDAWAAQMRPDRRRDWLAKAYAAGIVKGHKRAAAEFKYQAIFKGRPDHALRSAAWEIARAQTAAPPADGNGPHASLPGLGEPAP